MIRWASVALVLAATVLAGCATERPAEPKYIRDGVAYGDIRPFRGQWWNHYERGRSFLEGEFWPEAESDLRRALKERDKDQLWPRTYGLHFLPEYFPHRELGIVLYRQGDVEAAISELELSIQQQYSARAAYYLDQARSVRLRATGVDRAAPTVEILAPEPNIPVGAMAVTIEGIARDDAFVSAIMIAGEPYDVRVSQPEVAFSRVVSLDPGGNIIPVTVEDLTHKTWTQRVHVLCDVDGPTVGFDDPRTTPGSIHGAVYDPSGVTSLVIGDTPIMLHPNPDGTASFSVAIRPVDLHGPVRYTCVDSLGNVTQGQLPLAAFSQARNRPTVVFAVAPYRRTGFLYRLASSSAPIPAPTANEDLFPTIEITGIHEGQEYFLDAVVVGVRIRSAAAITEASLNGAPLSLIPGKAFQTLSRVVSLHEGPNVITAEVKTAAGTLTRDTKTIIRRLTTVEEHTQRLGIAFLEDAAFQRQPQSATELNLVFGNLPSALEAYDRFNIVNRRDVHEILGELQLTELLASTRGNLTVGKLIPADVMFDARIGRDSETIEIVLTGTCVDTGTMVVPHLDVAGPAEQLDQLVQTLALRLVQEFPRVQGTVVKYENPKAVIDLTRRQGLRRFMKCIFFRYTDDLVHPVTGEFLGRNTDILSEGLVTSVGERVSVAEILTGQPTKREVGFLIEKGHYVVLK